jgi:GR25 family glycosyltransferase involved in LPS biosynthesis
MKILDLFQRGYVINLPERVDRRQGAEKELKKLGMSFTPNKLELFPGIRPTELKGFPSIGAHGCFLSHLQVLKQAREAELTNVLIMEDDLFIDHRFKNVEASLMEQLSQEQWGIVHLGYSTTRLVEFPVQFESFREPLMTTTCYGVDSKIFDRLIDFLETVQRRPSGHPDGGPMHLDGAYNMFRQQNPDIIALKTSSVLIAQRSSRSDIYPNAWYDNVPVLSSATALIRESKTLVRSRRASLR